MEGSDEWTAKAYTAIGVATVAVAGGIMLWNRIDINRMERRKIWEEFNKTSIGEQLAESNKNTEKMRGHLHEMRNLEAQRIAEVGNLHLDLNVMRQQFIDVAKELHNAEVDLREANTTLKSTMGDVKSVQQRLTECEDDRIDLHKQLVLLAADRKTIGQHVEHLESITKDNQDRIHKIEESGEFPSVLQDPIG